MGSEAYVGDHGDEHHEETCQDADEEKVEGIFLATSDTFAKEPTVMIQSLDADFAVVAVFHLASPVSVAHPAKIFSIRLIFHIRNC